MAMTIPEFADLDAAVRAKLALCQEILRGLRRVVVAFSGGVDSTLLLALAVRTLGRDNVLGVIGVSPVVPEREVAEAKRLLSLLGAQGETIETHEVENPDFAANPPHHCYYCKQDLIGRLRTLAQHRGYEAVLIGNNADDAGDFRPGMRAAEELGARSPLLEAALTKTDIRCASRALDLPTWDKPAYACLASRVPYGQPIVPETLRRIEQAEYVLHDLGLRQCRVRDHQQAARIELPPGQFAELLQHRQHIVARLKELGYRYVTLDLQGFRSGSMNEMLPEQQNGRYATEQGAG